MIRTHNVLLPFFFRLRNLRVRDYFRHLEKTQYLPPEKLAELQLVKLKRLIRHASETVPYYRELFSKQGLVAGDIRTLDDIRQLPVLTKEQVVSEPISTFLSKGAGRAFVVRKTSGTSGHPVAVPIDSEAYAWSLAARCRCLKWHNIGIGDRQARFWGRADERRGRWLESVRDFTLSRQTINDNVLDSSSLSRQARRILAYRPDYIYGYTSLILALAQYLYEHEEVGGRVELKGVICTAEMLYSFQKRLMGEVFGCQIINEYGCSETDIVAFECERGKMHVIAERVLLEVVNADDSGTGEIVVTDLNNRLMPLIRYKLGDLGSISMDCCPCGRGLPILSRIEGRTNQRYILTPDGRKVHSVIFAHFVNHLDGQGIRIRQFRVIQTRLDTVVFCMVPRSTLDCGRIEALVSRKLVPQLGSHMVIQTRYVQHIEPSGEKFSYFQPYAGGEGSRRSPASEQLVCS